MLKNCRQPTAATHQAHGHDEGHDQHLRVFTVVCNRRGIIRAIDRGLLAMNEKAARMFVVHSTVTRAAPELIRDTFAILVNHMYLYLLRGRYLRWLK